MSFDCCRGGVLTVTAASGITNNGAANSITINLTGDAPADGTYTLINYSGSLRGTGFSAYQLGAAPVGKTYTLVNPAGAVQVTVAAGAGGHGPGGNTGRMDGCGGAPPHVLVGTSLTNFAIARAAAARFS